MWAVQVIQYSQRPVWCSCRLQVELGRENSQAAAAASTDVKRRITDVTMNVSASIDRERQQDDAQPVTTWIYILLLLTTP